LINRHADNDNDLFVVAFIFAQMTTTILLSRIYFFQPWNLPGDMKHFKTVTCKPPSPGLINAVVMGRKTWESIPSKFRPLPDRINVVLSRGGRAAIEGLPIAMNNDVLVATSLDDALEKIKSRPDHGFTYIIGGGEIYNSAMKSGLIDRVVYTKVEGLPEDTMYDAFFPEMKDEEWECVPYENGYNADASSAHTSKKAKIAAKVHVDEKSGLTYEFLEYIKRRNISPTTVSDVTVATAATNESEDEMAIPEGPEINPEEMQYLELCRDIIENGVKRGDRTGTGTLSKFGVQMRYSLRDNTLPLLTTKRTFWRGVAEELLWFVKGSTNANELAEKDIHIWDGNGSREFLDSLGLEHREQGDLGPVYGFQWRHFGAEYKDMHADYSGQGVDQLADCIDKIMNNPEDRRIIMSAWNPKDLKLMALPPCHMFCQFYVSKNRW
jgi:dihydrofolate reductase/thymidylate synthase